MKEEFPKPEWAIKQVVRQDRGGMVEDVCKHGVGHPNKHWLKKYGEEVDKIHGCCGCCGSD